MDQIHTHTNGTTAGHHPNNTTATQAKPSASVVAIICGVPSGASRIIESVRSVLPALIVGTANRFFGGSEARFENLVEALG